MKTLFSIILTFSTSIILAQDVLFLGAGNANEGGIFSFDPDTEQITDWKDFTRVHTPYRSYLKYHEKRMWGMTESGGGYGKGGIFFLDSSGTEITSVHSFNDSEGNAPVGALILSNNKFYGMTVYGGLHNKGVIFAVDTDGSDYSVLHHFDVSNPTGSLVESNGKLWGMISPDGMGYYGGIFSINTDGSVFTAVHDFDHLNGSNPKKNLIESKGKLWGVASSGGDNNAGIVFSLDTNGTNFKKVHDFDGINGRGPNSCLLEIDSLFWGVSISGGANNYGVIFNIKNDGTEFSKIYDLDLTSGRYPESSLTYCNNRIWGTTSDAGFNFEGTIFSVAGDGTDFKIEYNFSNNGDGRGSDSRMINVDGKLWGLTIRGGTENDGVIYTMKPEGSVYKLVYDFGWNAGSVPGKNFSYANKKMWGVLRDGGNFGNGIIYHVDPDGENFTKVHDFNYNSGTEPVGGIIYSYDRLWGLTREGGEGRGLIYSLAADGSDYTVEYIFKSGEGKDPNSGLVEIDDKFWGMTYSGGSHDCGVIYQVDVDTSGLILSKIHDFTGPEGKGPWGNLIESNGRLWGTTAYGGDEDNGVIFSLDMEGTDFTVEHKFDKPNGNSPAGNLTENGGKLWGIAYGGGVDNYGLIYSIGTDGSGFQNIHEFDKHNGRQPVGDLVEINGKFWGLTFYGGASNTGVIYSINTDGTNFEKEADLEASNGRPLGTLFPYALSKGLKEITLDPSNKTYGEEPGKLSISSISDAPVTFTSSDENIIFIRDDQRTAEIKNTGSVDITANQEEDALYMAASNSQTITVLPAALTATSDDQDIITGEDLPEFTISYDGFVYNDDASVLDEEPVASVDITDTDEEGIYSINLSGGSDNNYTITLVNGELLIDDGVRVEDFSVISLIYPNPSNNEFRISLQDDENYDHIILSDITGKIVKQYEYEEDRTYSLDGFTPGTYMLILTKGLSKKLGGKLIVE